MGAQAWHSADPHIVKAIPWLFNGRCALTGDAAQRAATTLKLCPTCRRPLTFGKTHDQRKRFHAICADIGKEIGLTPGQVKEAVKQTYFGLDEFKVKDKWYRIVKSSEEADRMEYSALIDAAIQWGAEAGVVIPDVS